jgi:hypothetical protein
MDSIDFPSSTDIEARVRASFHEQAKWCDVMGSPFTARVCRLLADRLTSSTDVGARILSWPTAPEPAHDALALRFCGGLHYLALTRRDQGIAALYPSLELPGGAAGDDALWEAISNAISTHVETLNGFLSSPPQTNEVARSGPLMLGFVTLAALTKMPMALFELGASAGLNQSPDRFRVTLGNHTFGPPTSILHLIPEWRGGAVPDDATDIEVISRRGVDRNPMNIHDHDTVERLMSYVWPDQFDRINRMKAGIAIARTGDVVVARGEASEWVEKEFQVNPTLGYTRVLYQSVAWQYFDADTIARIEARLAAAGGASRPDAPIAHLSMEKSDHWQGHDVMLRLWRGNGEERFLLARCHAHGAWIDAGV